MSYGSPQQAPPRGPLLGLLALVLGAFAVVVTFLPVNLDLARPYVAWTFGLPGLVIAALGLLGHRKGKPMAAIGAMLSLLALVIGAIAMANVVMH
ncbi:hypothetical protein [Lentzea flava]|uniref:Uncharacterized protein n=1 Tax=Lentzea flava TaxID=103732 RepID=A0ABQ2UDH7_9PSEU|nr:hypothetical protein [Lentzea flava]MCP2198079.1 hypothetical protein [Lentzea flava]GGU24511.1 hypothetical protein GCM10010178_15980 [Lentzea flava]